MPPATPRARSRRLLVGGFAAFAAGCGFRLRQPPALAFRTLQLRGFAPRSPLAETLRARLADADVRVVDTAAEAEAVLEALVDLRQRSVIASTAAGQVRELRLRTRFRFRLRTPAGRELIAATEMAPTRDMSYSESLALAKEEEEALLFRAMQQDIAEQVMRRLAAVTAV